MHLHKAVDRVLPTAPEDLLHLLVGVDVLEVARLLDDGAQHRPLRIVELAHVLTEVGLGGGLDPVGAPTEVDGVEVLLQDLIGSHVLPRLDRDQDLLELARVGAVLGETLVVVAGHLLGDGGAAALGAARKDGARRARDGDARLFIEVALLGGEHTVLHSFRDLVDSDRLPVDLTAGDRFRAVGEFDRRRGPVGLKLGRYILRVGGPHVHHAEHGHPRNEEEGASDQSRFPHLGEEAADRAALVVLVVVVPVRWAASAATAGRGGTAPALRACSVRCGASSAPLRFTTTTGALARAATGPCLGRSAARRALVVPETTAIVSTCPAAPGGAFVPGRAGGPAPTAVAAGGVARAICPAAPAGAPSSFGTHASSIASDRPMAYRLGGR
ncbi:hypothetical protein NORO109296_25425 [Nocardiopsis rhodophaea]